MPTSVPGSSGATATRTPQRRGFTLIELMVVLVLVALAAGVVSLALRDPARSRLEVEGVRLAALLEGARAESRALGLPVRWVPARAPGDDDFSFVGLPPSAQLPTRWLDRSVSAEVVGDTSLLLGPDAIIGAQRVLLRLDDQRLELATDGLAPFAVPATAP
jgi:general secretion pathway protein H